jgi:hypothetical protein
MKLVPFDRYAKAAEQAWEKDLLYEKEKEREREKQRVFYFGTEDIEVIQQAQSWANQATTSTSVHSLPLLPDILTEQRRSGKRHEDEYLSYLGNLQNLVHCEFTICTYLSNFCRVVDELRATVGGKANRYLAEVNEETCVDVTNNHVCIARDALIPPQKFAELDPRLW